MSNAAKSKAQPQQRGEAHELKEDLNSTSREVQKSALKKVIANMTVGRDVSNLFSDVVRLISSQHIDIKKLVYLYVIANAKMQQDKALLLAGTFCKDFQHESPLIRGLAIRTLSAVQVEKMADHLAAPLRDALRDQDPYVRKCAATAVAKMFNVNRQRAEDGGFLQHLQELLCDPNPTVVAAAVCALNEIRASSDIDRDLLDLNNRSGSLAVNNLLNALGDTHGCNEWGQVYILDGLSNYDAENSDKAEFICERILSRLQHANAAVVLSSVRIVMNFIERWCARGTTNEEVVRGYCQKIAPPLVSLVSGGTDFEIRYIALRNITLILQRFPDLLTSQVKVFFVKYNDPIYIKLEKLEIMLILVNHINVRDILSEFREYAMEVDVEFVRKAVRAIGVSAIKIESAAEECVGVLTELIRQKVNYVVQEAIIVTRDIFRKYPGRYESIIGLLCDSLESLEDSSAKAAMIWIIGEYADKIDNADELLEEFMESYDENESVEVRLAVLTAMVKLFLRRPDDTQELLQQVLKKASESEVPDLRDRGYIYWRLLSADPQAANSVVLGVKESINADEGTRMDPKLVTELMEHIGTISSVYHRPPETFMPAGTYHAQKKRQVEEEMEEEEEEEEAIEHDGQDGGGGALPQFEHAQYENPSAQAYAQPAAAYAQPAAAAPPAHADPMAAAAPAPAAAQASLDDMLGGGQESMPYHQREPSGAAAVPTLDPFQTVVPREQGAGIEMQGRFVSGGGLMHLDVQITNCAPQPISGFQMQLNSNIWGIALGALLAVAEPLNPAGVHQQRIVLSHQGQTQKHEGVPGHVMQVALKHSMGTCYGKVDFDPAHYFVEAPPMQKQAWLELWRSTEREDQFVLPAACGQPMVEQKLRSRHFQFIAKRSADQVDNVYWSLKMINDADILLEFRFNSADTSTVMVSCRTQSTDFVDPIKLWLARVLSTP